MSVELNQGRYVVVPSCKKPNETGDYYLSIYFSEGQEDPEEDDTFTHFKATYINPYQCEEKEHLQGYVIKEEDEDEQNYDEEFKRLLKIKSKYVIWNDDEDADKPYIPESLDPSTKAKEVEEEAPEPIPFEKSLFEVLVEK